MPVQVHLPFRQPSESVDLPFGQPVTMLPQWYHPGRAGPGSEGALSASDVTSDMQGKSCSWPEIPFALVVQSRRTDELVPSSELGVTRGCSKPTSTEEPGRAAHAV